MSRGTIHHIKQMLQEENTLCSEAPSEARRIRLHRLNHQLSNWAHRAPDLYTAAVDAHHDDREGAAA